MGAQAGVSAPELGYLLDPSQEQGRPREPPFSLLTPRVPTPCPRPFLPELLLATHTGCPCTSPSISVRPAPDATPPPRPTLHPCPPWSHHMAPVTPSCPQVPSDHQNHPWPAPTRGSSGSVLSLSPSSPEDHRPAHPRDQPLRLHPREAQLGHSPLLGSEGRGVPPIQHPAVLSQVGAVSTCHLNPHPGPSSPWPLPTLAPPPHPGPSSPGPSSSPWSLLPRALLPPYHTSSQTSCALPAPTRLRSALLAPGSLRA